MASTRGIENAPRADNMASAAMATHRRRSEPRMSRLREKRSPRGPSTGVSTVWTTIAGARIADILTGDLVTSRIHQASAMLPHASPTVEIICPVWNNQKFLPRRSSRVVVFK